ncbi:unnamed protein product [Acanthoscelides obtectus]|uniref:Uncharacterized protein n=1 Tax=Acanthoscelides obtectus TaxID=200917 RepID=A0A9P0Q250_ACAOB|nr:unnamed protein product [Acanthoscelides obtectus]CAK1641591.1 hypothetical protein AOBTE_LOCUS12496 [Acanthoscelides obtectus]
MLPPDAPDAGKGNFSLKTHTPVRYQDGSLCANGRINGRVYSFLVDTGAMKVICPMKSLRKLLSSHLEARHREGSCRCCTWRGGRDDADRLRELPPSCPGTLGLDAMNSHGLETPHPQSWSRGANSDTIMKSCVEDMPNIYKRKSLERAKWTEEQLKSTMSTVKDEGLSVRQAGKTDWFGILKKCKKWISTY